MKRLDRIVLALGLLALLSGIGHAVPMSDIISYQGKLTDAAGAPVANGTQNVTFKIYENGAIVFTQTASVATLGGVFSAFLNVGTLAFDPGKQYELSVTFNGIELPPQSIASVPSAKVAQSVTGPGSVPVGGVMMWWSDGTVPSGWALCDGSVVANPASPLNGKTLPDMTKKFARGVANSDLRTVPVSGGSDVDNHTHTISADGIHTHTVNPHTHGIWADGDHRHSIAVDGNAQQLTGTGGSGIWVSDASHSHGAFTGGAGQHDHRGSTQPASPGTDAQGNHNHGGVTGPSSTSDNPENNVPAYVGLVFIIRII